MSELDHLTTDELLSRLPSQHFTDMNPEWRYWYHCSPGTTWRDTTITAVGQWEVTATEYDVTDGGMGSREVASAVSPDLRAALIDVLKQLGGEDE